MPASPSSNSADQPIPTGLRDLLERKIKSRRRELDQFLVSRQAEIFDKLTERIQEYLPDSSQRPGRFTIFRVTYREMVALAVEISQRWPRMVWQSILETAESTALAPENVGDLQQLLEQFTWKEASDAFTLELIEPGRVQSAMDRILRGYGLPECMVEAHFEHRRNLEVAGAKVSVQEAARGGKEHASLAIESFRFSDSNRIDPSSKESQPPTGANSDYDCIPNPPKRRDEWYYAIRDAAREFYEQSGERPTAEKLWIQLRNSPPSNYGITSGKDRGEEPAILMDELTLSKRAFKQRWARYIQRNPTQ